ncbi:MAG: PAS domain S-box protein [Prosthecobacter sp.]|uniref:PAS domain S-box protein n=1 Tax=Prosthecobacter sp. TaxID=1965333 RepID=UPI003900AE7C
MPTQHPETQGHGGGSAGTGNGHPPPPTPVALLPGSWTHPDSAPRLSRVATCCALLVLALGIAVMAGWLFEIERLKRLLPQLATMKFNAALGFLLAGAALVFRATPALRLGLAAAVGLLGALTLGQYLTGADFGIDQLIIRDAEVVAGQPAGRMSPVAALCFILSSAALALLRRGATQRWAEALAISVGTVGFIALLGYAFGTQHLYSIPGFTSLALHTAVGFAVLAVGLLYTVRGGIIELLMRSRSTGRALWLGFGALTALLIILGVVSASRLHSIGADVDAMADIVRPRSVAVRELEINVLAAYDAHRAATQANIQHTEAVTLLLLIGGIVLALVTSGIVVRVVLGSLEERRVSELRYRLLVEQSPDGIFLADNAGRYTDVNPAGAEMLGYTHEEILSRGIADVIVPEELPKLAAKLSTYTDAAISQVQWRFRRKDGSEFDGEVVGRQRPEGGYLGILRDITERSRAEAALSQNAALFAKIIEQAPGGVYVMDAQLRVREVNTEALPVFATVQPVIGRELGEVLEALWGPELGQECTANFRHTLETGERYISPRFDHLRQDIGVEQAYEWETQRLTLPDGQHGVVCYFQDVTAKERAAAALYTSEAHMQLATEATEVGIWEWNVLTNQMRWDAQMFRLYGIAPTPDGLVPYQTWAGAVLPEDLAANEAILQDTVRRLGRSTRTFRIRRADDGECRYIKAVETVRTNAQGQAEWVLGTNLDVTERRRAEAALRAEVAERKQAEEQVRLLNRDLEQRVADRTAELALKASLLSEQNAAVELARVTLDEKATALALASKYKSEFLANMSHELRTPLNPILILSQQLAENKAGNLTAKQVEFSQHIHSSGTELLTLISDILDLAKIESGTVSLEVAEIPFAELHGTIDRNLRHIAEAKNLPFHVTIAPDLPPAIVSDPRRLQQILKNLLSNAVKFTASGQVEVRVDVATQGWTPDHPVLSKAAQVIAFAVTDTGIGIAPEKQRLIFEAFQQSDASTARTYGGTGLGLAISRELAALLGGEITVSSVLGAGSTFTLYVPLHHTGPNNVRTVPTKVPPAWKLNATPHPHAPDAALRGRKVLVVDDDARNIFALTAVLEDHEMEVLSTTSGRSAVDLILHTPDLSLVLMDIMLPEMDGYETMREIRRAPGSRTLPIVVLTAKAMQGDREKCLDAGASDYLAKPVNTEQLLTVMRVWMSRQETSTIGAPCSAIVNEFAEGLTSDEQGVPIVEVEKT